MYKYPLLDYVVDYISISIVPFVLYTLLAYVCTKNIVFIHIFLLTIFVGISTEFIKTVVAKNTCKRLFYRPEGCRQCSLLNLPSDPNAPAFPSGHVAMTTFLVFSLLTITKHTGLTYVMFGVLYILLMGFSRYHKKCHNLIQIICGLLYGAFCYVIFMKLYVNQ